MNVIKKITAFFTMKGKQEEIELEAAEVNSDGVFLHHTEDPDHSFFIKSEKVEIYINPGMELTEDDILVVDNKKKNERKEAINRKPAEATDEMGLRYVRPRALSSFMPSKRRFSVMLYEDEYDVLMRTIQDNGYKKVEYFLACMTSAKKQSFASEYKQYTAKHAKRYKSDLSEAKRAQAEDYHSRRAELESKETTA